MKQPHGFILVETSSLVCKLNQSLYVLKQAPRAWYEKIDTYFLSNGFKKCISDPTLYVKNFGDDILIIVLYLDDLIITGSQLISIQKLKENLKNEIEMTNLGLFHFFGVFKFGIWPMVFFFLIQNMPQIFFLGFIWVIVKHHHLHFSKV